MTRIAELHARLAAEVQKVLVGQEEALRLLLLALVCEGHVLLEGVPGVAKTTLARALARVLGLPFRRIQFTPDLMPADILGTQVFDFQAGRFHLVEGPVFTNVLLADEINRAPAKTQSGLLEAMQERQVSLDGTARPLPRPFLVLATQNPVEQEGTYPLPEAQLDRFLFKIAMGYPSLEEECRMLELHRADAAGLSALLESLVVVTTPDELALVKGEALAVRVEPPLVQYAASLVRATRGHDDLRLGGSPRASLLLLLAARAFAALEGRDYLIPDDLKRLFRPVLGHRVVLAAAAEVDGTDVGQVLTRIADGVPVPR